MVRSNAATVEEYLAELPPDRAEVIGTVRGTILERLPAGYEETMNWGMISYQIPLSRSPTTYNGQPLGIAALAAQARYYALYLNAVYTTPALERKLRDAYAATGKKLDLGKSCLRFRNLERLELGVVGDILAAVTPEQHIAVYEASRRGRPPAGAGRAATVARVSAETPGFVCAHHHLYSALARGMPAPPGTPGNFGEILRQIWWRLDAALDLEMLSASARLGALEALLAGTTGIVDHHESPNAIEGSLDVIADGVCGGRRAGGVRVRRHRSPRRPMARRAG